jgi:hypothetical protein
MTFHDIAILPKVIYISRLRHCCLDMQVSRGALHFPPSLHSFLYSTLGASLPIAAFAVLHFPHQTEPYTKDTPSNPTDVFVVCTSMLYMLTILGLGTIPSHSLSPFSCFIMVNLTNGREEELGRLFVFKICISNQSKI